MRFAATLAAAAAISAVGIAAQAGNPEPPMMDAPVVVIDDAQPEPSSINGVYVVVGVLAALLIAAAANAD